MRRRSSFTAFFGALALLGGLAVAMAPSAFAGSLTPLQCVKDLAQDGTPLGGTAYCQQRDDIYLAAGTYKITSQLLDYRGGSVINSYSTKNVYFPAGTYSWNCYAKQGTSQMPYVQKYSVYCSLFKGPYYYNGTPMALDNVRLPYSGSYTLRGQFSSV